MDQAILEAKIAFSNGNVPVGSVIVKDKKIISRAHNKKKLSPFFHAEYLAIIKAIKILNNSKLDDFKLSDTYELNDSKDVVFLKECDIYVTLEPCPFCASLMSFLRMRSLYFGAYDPKSGGVDHNTYTFHNMHHHINSFGGIKEMECEKLLKLYFKNKRD